MLRIKLRDVWRATLPGVSGNEGWIGVSPRGDQYHVVVPVDTQIARGVMACNLPTDGTPFGGYTGWLYFRCPPYEDCDADEKTLREAKARETAESLISWLAAQGIAGCIGGTPPRSRCESDEYAPSRSSVKTHEEQGASDSRLQLRDLSTADPQSISCSQCGKLWEKIGEFLRDDEAQLEGYRACLDDFTRGSYLFAHTCGGTVEVPVSRFARGRRPGRLLIGSHACPGLCYYERSLRACSASCEGAGYRRIAERLGARRRAKTI
jgi:hypothetical protein